MKLRFEMMTRFLPHVRSFVAKELVFRYKMSQIEAADLLGITQPAISQYLNNVRGRSKLLEKKEVVDILQGLAKNIYERRADEAHITAELHKIYEIVTGGINIPAAQSVLSEAGKAETLTTEGP